MSSKILIVEDENIIAMDLKCTLESFGYNVLGICFTGEEAIERVKTEKPDLILMDIKIQGRLDGLDTAQMLSGYKIPILFLSAHTNRINHEKTKDIVAYGVIAKPFNDKMLYSTVKELLKEQSYSMRL